MCELVDITPNNISRHELLGLNVLVEWKKGDRRSVDGVVIGETRNMIKVKSSYGVLLFPKESCDFVFTLPSGLKVRVDGKILIGRPEDRLKRVVRRW